MRELPCKAHQGGGMSDPVAAQEMVSLRLMRIDVSVGDLRMDQKVRNKTTSQKFMGKKR